MQRPATSRAVAHQERCADHRCTVGRCGEDCTLTGDFLPAIEIDGGNLMLFSIGGGPRSIENLF